MKLNSIKNAKVKGQTVLVRVDYNVPIENGKVMDDSRIVESLPTLEYLLKEGAKVIVMSHLGRPEGEVVEELMLNPVAVRLGELLKKEVIKVDDCVGEEVEGAVKALGEGSILMLENTRFNEGEKSNDHEFAKQLASYADLYVSDAFGTAHRAHASTEGVAQLLPSYAGFLIEKEVKALTPLLGDVEGPFVLLLGGAKIDTKIGVIKAYLEKADKILLGGGLANTFVAAEGYNVGESLYEPDKLEVAREIMLEAEKQSCEIVLPGGFIVADEVGDNVLTADMEITGVEANMKMLDIGVKTLYKYLDILQEAKVIIWNGPVGLYEKTPFSRGTREIADALQNVKGKTYIGGGDTLSALTHFGFDRDKYTHVSTGGGAMLEFLEGKELPGLKVLVG
ncbi:phosphoglycerate kinase [Patescibacteria group bacterium]